MQYFLFAISKLLHQKNTCLRKKQADVLQVNMIFTDFMYCAQGKAETAAG
jgi:hypothetical protein